MKAWSIALVLVIVASIAVYVIYASIKPSMNYPQTSAVPSESQVPQNVKNTYEEMLNKYKQSLGAKLLFCRKGDSAGYRVTGSSGFTAESFYFDPSGTRIRHSQWGDVPSKNPDPEIFAGFNCTPLLEDAGAVGRQRERGV